MRKLMKIVVALLIVLILIAGGVGGYLWYDTKQHVDQFVMMTKPFAEISYGGIEVRRPDRWGSAATDLAQHGERCDHHRRCSDARPQHSGPAKTRWQLSQGELPSALSLSVREFELPCTAAFSASPPSSQQSGPLEDLDALGCGQVAHLGGTEWQEMGYDHFIGNVEIGYHLDAARNVLAVRVDSNTRDWATLNMDIGFAIPGPCAPSWNWPPKPNPGWPA